MLFPFGFSCLRLLSASLLLPGCHKILEFFETFYFIWEYCGITMFFWFQIYSSDLGTHVSILQVFFPLRLLHNIEQRSLCYTVGSCWLYILNIAVCTHPSQTS